MSLILLFLFAFLTIQVSCEDKGSLAFIIDDTGSSVDELRAVKSAAKTIRVISLVQTSAPIEDMVVVTFNDPDVRLRMRTSDARVFRKTLESILVGGGGDCPEMSLSGIKTGLEESRPGSFLFVFTDASAKDHAKFEEVKALCQEKKSQITFILTGTCGRFTPHPQMDDVYGHLAAACGGAVLRITKNQTAFVYQYVREYMNVAKNAITSKKLPSSQWTEISFNKDDSTESIVVTAWGTDVELQVVDQEDRITKDNVGLHKNFKVLKLTDVPNGRVTVKAKSSSTGHMVVYGNSPAATTNDTNDTRGY